MASGCLSAVNRPAYDGLDEFEGDWYHTARWPQYGVALAGKRVGVIGTGSTGIQLIPQLAKGAEHLYVFQRTANFSMPAHNAPLDPERQRAVKASYRERRRLARESLSGVPRSHPDAVPQRSALEVAPQAREAIYERGWAEGGIGGVLLAFNDINTNAEANARPPSSCAPRSVRPSRTRPPPRRCARPRIRSAPSASASTSTITRPTTATTSHSSTSATTRSSGSPGAGSGPRSDDYALDVIVFATGFDAMTGALLGIDIRGRGGRPLKQKWSNGPRTYLGLATAGFPNMFLVTGPGSPSVLSNMVCSIEQHIDWIADCIGHLREHELETIEAMPDAEDGWVAHVEEVAEATLFPLANSWYVGANIPGKARVFMPYLGGVGNYRRRCDEVARNGYEGFSVDRQLAGARS